MAKAKFPGKPSKTSQIARLRVSSRSVDSMASDTARIAAKQTASGLLLFNQTFLDEDEGDLHGFEKDTAGFKAHYCPKLVKENRTHSILPRDTPINDGKNGLKLVPGQPTIRGTTPKAHNKSHENTVFSNQQLVAKNTHPSSDFLRINENNSKGLASGFSTHTLHNGGNENRLARKLLEKAKSPKRFVLPSKSVHSSRPIIPNKRFLEGMDAVRRRKCSAAQEKNLGKQSFQNLVHPIQDRSVSKQEKDKMKREIERYTDIMTTDITNQKPSKIEHKYHSLSSEQDKEGKLREKIQQLLRSQWESRLQVVDTKGDLPVTKTKENCERLGNSEPLSSEQGQIVSKSRRVANGNANSTSNSMKSKIILRKARLQLNQKLLKQLRQPSRLQQFRQQLVETKNQPVDPPRLAHQTQSSSIIRPAQLVLLSPTPQVQSTCVPSSTAPNRKELPCNVPLPSPALLKLSNLEDIGEVGVDNPLGCAFVMETSDTKGLPGTVVCGVCGAVRRYSFILQARKFGTFSCEPCRKFISRVLRARIPVKCASGTGHCIHPPVLRWNNACPPEDKPPGGEVMTSRCKACWLKLALTGFRMRESDHDDLRKLLPIDMKDLVPTAANRPEYLPWAPNRGQMIRIKRNSSAKLTLKRQSPPPIPELTAAEAVIQQELRIESQESLSTDADLSSSDNKSKLTRAAEHCAGSRTRKKNADDKTLASSRPSLKANSPRIKRVCRSASLALGQPRAVFETEESTASSISPQKDDACACCSSYESSFPVPASSEFSPRKLTGGSRVTENSTKQQSVNRSSDRKNSSGSPARPLTITQGEPIPATCSDATVGPNIRVLRRVGLTTPTVQAWQQQETSQIFVTGPFNCSLNSNSTWRKTAQIRRKVNLHRREGLLLDFWERYDASRVWKQGFAVIGSQKTTLLLCYLCGSAGRDELVLCSSCCEPFHPFCVADSSPQSLHNENGSKPSCTHWIKHSLGVDDERASTDQSVGTRSSLVSSKKSWTCRNCLVCRVCRSDVGEKIVCAFCGLAYHWACLGPAHPCKKSNRSHWSCFDCSAPQDRTCPLCMERQQNEGALEPRLQCSCCQRWTHARCEQLGDEEFRLLTTQADIEYVCRSCTEDQPWTATLRQLLKVSYVTALKNLSSCQSVKPEQIHQIKQAIEQDQLPSCADFCRDVRRLVGTVDGFEATLLAAMPWLHTGAEKIVVQSSRTLDDLSGTVPREVQKQVECDYESDSRHCSLCQGRGEGRASVEGRLLYCSNDEWVHVNCALWSNEVFEEVDGALQNVFDALARSRTSRCGLCSQKGATLNCCRRGCSASFHFPCAVNQPRMILLQDKRILCVEHAMQVERTIETVETNFEVARCVYVDLGTESKRIKPRPPKEISVTVGSLSVTSLGHVCIDVSLVDQLIHPVGFQCHRKYWSTKEPWKLTSYTCNIIYVPGPADCAETDMNITVSHEDDDVIMAESGLNLAELDTPDDRELIHMVLEDANFEQELEGGSTSTPTSAAVSSLSNFKDSGFYSDDHSVDGMSPSPTEDPALSLEAWLADPEHAVILLDSALLASLDIDTVSSPLQSTSSESAPLSSHNSTSIVNGKAEPEFRVDSARKIAGSNFNRNIKIKNNDNNNNSNNTKSNINSNGRSSSSNRTIRCNNYKNMDPIGNTSKRRLSYSEWKKIKMQTQSSKTTPWVIAKRGRPISMSVDCSTSLDWNGNEAQWKRSSRELVASIKVSPLSHSMNMTAVEASPWRKTASNILQLDGANDSSETETEREFSVKIEAQVNDEPVKCQRCRRSYRTWQSFNKHTEICVELLSSDSSTNEEDSDSEVMVVQAKMEPLEVVDIHRDHPPDPVEELVINSWPQAKVTAQATDGSSQLEASSNAVSAANLAATKPVPGNATVVKPIPSTTPNQRPTKRRRKPKLSNTSCRPLAARVDHAPLLDPQMMTQTSQLPTIHLTLQSPQPPPLVYVTNRPEMTNLLSPAPSATHHQPIYIISSPFEQTFGSPSLSQHTFSAPSSLRHATFTTTTNLGQSPQVPFLQYLGPMPSNMSTLGLMGLTNVGLPNMDVSPVPTLVQNQLHLPTWESPISSQFVYLQQPQVMFNATPTIVPIAHPNFVSLEAIQQPVRVDVALTEQTVPSPPPSPLPSLSPSPTPPSPPAPPSPPTPSLSPSLPPIPSSSSPPSSSVQVAVANLETTSHASSKSTAESLTAYESVPVAFEPLVENCYSPELNADTVLVPTKEVAEVKNSLTENILAERSYVGHEPISAVEMALPPTLNDAPKENVTNVESKPPRPTYSYRSVMGSTGRRNPRTVALLSMEGLRNQAYEEQSKLQAPLPFNQQLKVVAHSSSPITEPRTFKLKAVPADDTKNDATRDLGTIRKDLTHFECHLNTSSEDAPTQSAWKSGSPLPDKANENHIAENSMTVLPPLPLPSPLSSTVSSCTVDCASATYLKDCYPQEPRREPIDRTKKHLGVRKPIRGAHIVYELKSDDGFYVKSESLADVWKQLLDTVQDARLAYGLEPISSCKSVDSNEQALHMVGLSHNALRYLLEQLPNANRCSGYDFRYHQPRKESEKEVVVGSPFGCARSAPYSSRRRCDMFSWLASQHRLQPQPSISGTVGDVDVHPSGVRRATSLDLQPLAQRYRVMRQGGKQSVGVFRSGIHGRGLFSKRDIEPGEMVVEYAGEVIRSVVCDKREKHYELKGMGCYMFRVDDQTVVDATMHGNCARFINHSCEPNCYSRIVDILGRKHIIIFALRRILRGEELTYDYKFPIEDVKIRCSCGSRKCRKYLN